jgi:hypothetical protein
MCAGVRSCVKYMTSSLSTTTHIILLSHMCGFPRVHFPNCLGLMSSKDTSCVAMILILDV